MPERFTSRPPAGTDVVLPNGTEGVVLTDAFQVDDPQRVRVAWDDGHVIVVAVALLSAPRDIRAELVEMLVEHGFQADDYHEAQADAILAAGWRPR